MLNATTEELQTLLIQPLDGNNSSLLSTIAVSINLLHVVSDSVQHVASN